jgi:hypothetical protein
VELGALVLWGMAHHRDGMGRVRKPRGSSPVVTWGCGMVGYGQRRGRAVVVVGVHRGWGSGHGG